MIKKLLVVAVIALVIYMGLRLAQKSPLPMPTELIEIATGEKLSDQAKAPIELDLPLPPTKIADVDCESERKILFDHSVSQLLQQLQTGSLKLRAACTPGVLGMDVNTCEQAAQSPDDKTQSQACQSFLMMARARLVERLTADWDHYDSMELSVLVNKIFATLTRESSLTPVERTEWREMTEALIRRNPENGEAIKAHLMTFLTDQGEDSMDADSEIWGWVARGLGVAGNDPQLRELALFGELQKDDALTRLKAQIAAHPHEALAHYYLAAYFWRQQDRAGALFELALAVQAEPKNQRFRDSLNLAQNPKTDFGEKIFALQVGFNWDQL